jgi:DNA-binding response OmpR family regulator
MLTGLGEEADRIVGLEIGADDYLPKTFSTRELLARLRAVIRRSRAHGAAEADQESEPPVRTVGDLIIESRIAHRVAGGAAADLTAVEFDLLLSLARSAGRVKTRERLLIEVAERDFRSLRPFHRRPHFLDPPQAGRRPEGAAFIQTIRSVGYLMLKPGVTPNVE